MYGIVICMCVVSFGMVGMHAHAEITPISEITSVVLNVQLYVNNERFDAYPIYYPDVIPDKPITEKLIHYTGQQVDTADTIVLVELNSTSFIPDILHDIRGASLVIFYGIDDWTIHDDAISKRIPAIRVSNEDGASLASASGGDVAAFVLFGPGTYDALEGAIDIETITIQERVFAVVTGDTGAQIIDITDPAWPVPAATVHPDSIRQYHTVNTVIVSDAPYAILGGKMGIEIINITDPYNPIPASILLDDENNYDTIRDVDDIETFIQTGRTYAIATSYGDDGMQIIDITNPYVPIAISSVTDNDEGFEALSGAKGLDITTISDRLYAVVAGYRYDSVQLVDIINPYNPLPISIFPNSTQSDLMGGPTDVETIETREGVFAIVTAHEDNAIQIINITTPTMPLHDNNLVDGVGRYVALAGAAEIAISDISGTLHAVITGNYDDAIQIISLDNKAQVRSVSNTIDDDDYDYELDGAWGVDMVSINDKTYAIVASYRSDGIQIIDLERPASPVLASGAFNVDDTELVVEGSWGVDTFTISEKTYGIVANYHDDAVQIIDVSNPYVPQPVAGALDGINDFDALDGATDVETFAVSDRTYAVIASYEDDGIQIMDITDPMSPVGLAVAYDDTNGFEALDGAIDVKTISVSGRIHAMVAGYDEDAVQILDLTNPGVPLPLGTIQRDAEYTRDRESGGEETAKVIGLDGPRGIEMVTISGKTYGIVASENDDTVSVFDIHRPTLPWPISYVYDDGDGFNALDGATDIQVVTMRGIPYGVVTAKWDRGVQIIDFSDPESPLPVYSIFDNTDGFQALAGANKLEIVFAPNMLAAVSSLLDDAVQFIDISNPARPVPVFHAFDRTNGFDSLKGADDIAVFLIDGSLYAMVAGVEDRAIQIMKIS